MNRTFAAILAFITWSALMFAAGWAWRADRADGAQAADQRDTAQAQVAAEQGARATEQSAAADLAEIGTRHEEDRAHAETVPAAVAADLRAGNLRLRREWAGCETQRLSDAAAATAERDALAASRDEAAGRIVRIGRDADDQLRACQAVIFADREHQATP